MAARYLPAEVEQRLMTQWLEASAFRARIDAPGEPYSIVIPPPNVTGSLHMGHALNSTIQDILTRYNHKLGRNTLWLVGTDHAGIATQNKVEVALAAEVGKRKEDIGRAAFEERVWEWRRAYGSTIIHQLKRLGCSCDYERERFTMDEAYQKAVARVFVDLYNKGDIYRDVYLVNWCTRCGSAISDLEVEHFERQDKLYYVRYPVEGEDDFLTVATTRPETILGDTAVAVNPRDPRYGKYVGKRARVPLTDRWVPIIADEHVDIEFGTGALKITPAHDPDDFEIGLRHKLESISVITPDGRMIAEAGELAGMDMGQARDVSISLLEKEGLFVKDEDYTHKVGHCYRCGTVIEPLLSLQWFMNMERLVKPAIAAVEDGRVRFAPERWGGVYLDWMRGIRPWCISRQLWWGHRLPVWYCDACGEMVVSTVEPQGCPGCGGELRREEDVLDTWFSSALWPFATLGWPEQTPELSKYYPTSVLSTARDIIYLWVARMIMTGLEFPGDVPFKDVIIHPTIMAADGRRMSKSLGTGVDPLELIDEYGADATRFGLVYMSSVQDVRFSNERIEMGRNFANKIWNASRFVLQGVPEGARAAADPETAADRWILSRLSAVTADLIRLYESYDFAEAARVIYRFVWNEFCDWYVEMAKARLYGQDATARDRVAGNLLFVLEHLLGLLHPLMPFVTEEIYRHLPGMQVEADGRAAQEAASPAMRPAMLFEAPFPRPEPAWSDSAAEKAMDVFATVVTGLRSTREELEIPRATVGRVWLVAPRPEAAAAIAQQSESFRQLCGCECVDVVGDEADVPAGRHASIEVPGAGVTALLDLTDLVDVEKEKSRLLSRAAKARQEWARSQAKLGKESFVARAPAEVVEEERNRLAQAEAALADISRRYRERVGEELPPA
ncbi:MAG: valine--tRNA ligase [Gaiellales bacterium]|nr:valine--tRNA ligase [Gaiellales bacterium]